MPSTAQALEKLSKAVEQHRDEGGGVTNWWRWPLVILLVLIAAAVFAWFSRRNSKELAMLRHEKKKQEVLIAQAESDALVDDAWTTVKAYGARIEESKKKIATIDEQIAFVEAQLEADKAAIGRIRTWDDVGITPGEG
jgi:uncharacterized protein HemX